jgi:hypothetical protein
VNTTLATPRRPESTVQPQHPQPVRRVGIVDRAALHVGVALIKWGRRPGTTPARERRANRVELALLHRDRQHALASLASESVTVDYMSSLAPLR